jgi:hypothetical protein
MNLRPYRPLAVDPWSLDVLSLVDLDHAQEPPHATGGPLRAPAAPSRLLTHALAIQPTCLPAERLQRKRGNPR